MFCISLIKSVLNVVTNTNLKIAQRELLKNSVY